MADFRSSALFTRGWTGALLLFAAAGLGLAAGCTRNRYDLELKPQGEQLHRKLSMWREGTGADDAAGAPAAKPVEAEEAARIAKAYGRPPTSLPDGRQEVEGDFGFEMPTDVGGAGSYVHWKTDLGSVSGYLERFRGTDDCQAMLDVRRAAVNRMVALIDGWLAEEFGEQGSLLREFVARHAGPDLHNLSLFLWAQMLAGEGKASSNSKWEATVSFTVLQFLAERGYFDFRELPQLNWAWESWPHDPAPLLGWARKTVLQKMDAPRDAASDDLVDAWDQHLRSLEAFLRRTEEFKRLQRESKKTPESGFDILSRQALIAFLGDHEFLTPADRLDVALQVGAAPFLTNGEFQEGRVVWNSSIAPAGQTAAPSALLVAIWSEPDAAAQRRHLGVVALEGEALAAYCLWRRGLPEKEAGEWDRWMAGVRPGPQLVERLRQFRFSGEAPQKPPRALTALNLLLNAVGGEEIDPSEFDQ